MTEAVAAYDGDGLMIGRKVCRCADCEHSPDKGHKCNYFAIGYWDTEQEIDVIIQADVTPDGFCAWGVEKRN